MKTKLTFLFILIFSCIFSQKGKISGFIYLGHKVEEPNERRRPDPKNVINYL